MANKVFAFTGVDADMKSAFCDAIENLRHLKEAVGTDWNKLHWDGCHVSGGMTDIPAVKSCKLLDMSYDFSSLFEFNGLMSVRAHQATEYCLEHSEIAPSKPNNLYALDLGRVYSQEDLIPSVFDYKILGDLYRVYAKDAHGSVVSDNLFTDRLKAMRRANKLILEHQNGFVTVSVKSESGSATSALFTYAPIPSAESKQLWLFWGIETD